LNPSARAAYGTSAPHFAWSTSSAAKHALLTSSSRTRQILGGRTTCVKAGELSPVRTDQDLTPVPSGDSLESSGTLRFVDPQHLRALLEGAGYRIDGWFGDWDRTPVTSASAEVIVVATRPK
jgi:hypothetical protein